jgi:hypothetical protein
MDKMEEVEEVGVKMVMVETSVMVMVAVVD